MAVRSEVNGTPMRYISTRGQAPVLTFEETMLTGLARDGGLYVPEEVRSCLPTRSPVSLESPTRTSHSR